MLDLATGSSASHLDMRSEQETGPCLLLVDVYRQDEGYRRASSWAESSAVSWPVSQGGGTQLGSTLRMKRS